MKTKIKNLLKKISENSLAFVLGLLLFGGVASVYAAWNTAKVAGDPLTATDWNAMVAVINTKLSAESDPQVGTLTSGKLCTSDGTTVNCNTSSVADGFVLGATAPKGTKCGTTSLGRSKVAVDLLTGKIVIEYYAIVNSTDGVTYNYQYRYYYGNDTWGICKTEVRRINSAY